MGLAIRMAVTVTPPELAGVLVWWGVMLAAPALLLRRWRRRHRGASLRRRWRSPLRSREANAPASTRQGGPTSPRGAPDPLAAHPAWLDELDAASQSSAGALPSAGRAPVDMSADTGCGSGVDAVLSTEALAPLCRFVDFRRRLELAVEEVELRLSELPAERWRIEPYPLTGERRNTLLLLGETGVFVISATYAPGHWDDVIAASKLARKIQLLLPGYPGKVQPAICHPFSSSQPRLWHRPDEDGTWAGAWVLGGDSVIGWLEHFGPKHGLAPAELERFDELAKPNWLKPAIPVTASWPEIPEAAPPGAN